MLVETIFHRQKGRRRAENKTARAIASNATAVGRLNEVATGDYFCQVRFL
jgi:hypothetical protein